jgi:hypothetical protein
MAIRPTAPPWDVVAGTLVFPAGKSGRFDLLGRFSSPGDAERAVTAVNSQASLARVLRQIAEWTAAPGDQRPAIRHLAEATLQIIGETVPNKTVGSC